MEVNRQQLVETLKKNLEKHVADYEEAKAGYRSTLLSKLEDAYQRAKVQIDECYEKVKEEVSQLTDDSIESQGNWVVLLHEISVNMPVPKSYASEYRAAIDMAEWDVRETLELTSAEFNCFVRDQWDWQSEFQTLSTMYKRAV